jgi:hypothetical protein
MKKTLSLLVILSLLLTQKSNAQLEKGNVLVGSQLANFRIALKAGQETSIELTPNAAWFIKDNVAVGPYVNLGFSSVKDDHTLTTYGVGLLGRYYVHKPDLSPLKHGAFFGAANVGLGGTNYKDKKPNPNNYSTNGLDIGFGAGYAYFITTNISFETLLRYNGTIGFGNVAYTNYLNLALGFAIYLPGKSTMHKVESDVK